MKVRNGYSTVSKPTFFVNLRMGGGGVRGLHFLFNLKKLIKQCNKTKTKEKSKMTKELYILQIVIV